MNKLYRSLTMLLLVFCMLLVCGCAQNANESVSGFESSESEANTEQSKDPEASDVSVSECVYMTTDKTEYTSKDEYINVMLVSAHKNEEISYGDGFFIEYWDGTGWKRCEKDFEWTLEVSTFVNVGIYRLDLKERISGGYEKYRVVNDFRSLCGENISATAYSNEFAYIP